MDNEQRVQAMIDEIRVNMRKANRYAKIVAVECFVLGLLLGSLVMRIVLTR